MMENEVMHALYYERSENPLLRTIVAIAKKNEIKCPQLFDRNVCGVSNYKMRVIVDSRIRSVSKKHHRTTL